jgi:hypothetical protein
MFTLGVAHTHHGTYVHGRCPNLLLLLLLAARAPALPAKLCP